jgi:hypothetical protein
MTDLPAMLYAVIFAAVGAAILFFVYKGCLKVVEWREQND